MLNLDLRTAVLLTMIGCTPSAWAENTQTVPVTSTIPPTTATLAPVAIPAPQVARAAFTTGITAREPDSQLARISAGQTVYYFTELVGLQGHVITHRWEKDGAFQLGLQFPVGGQRWRVHSSKTITPDLPGTWTVTVQNDDGTVLRQDTLVVDPIIPTDSATPTTLAPPAAPVPAPTPIVAPDPATITPPLPLPEKSKQAIWDTLPR